MKELGDKELIELKKKIEDKRNEVNQLLHRYYEQSSTPTEEASVFPFREYVNSKKGNFLTRTKKKFYVWKESGKTKLYNWLYNVLYKTRVGVDSFLSDLSIKLFVMRHKNKIKDMKRIMDYMDKKDRTYVLSLPDQAREKSEDWQHGEYDGIVYKNK